MREVRALEVELARRLKAGDAGALELFLEIFRDRIFAYSQLHCDRRQDSEEVAQEIVLRVCEQAAGVEEAERVRAWVFGIAREVCNTYGRGEPGGIDQILSLEHLPGHWVQEMKDRHVLPDDEAYQHELRKLLGTAISDLPRDCRAVVYLRDWEGLSWNDVEAVLGIREEVARVLLDQGHALVRRKLNAGFVGGRDKRPSA